MARYDSLLLRIWRRDGVEGERWVGQVEHVQDGKVVRFSDREALLAYLWVMVGSQEQPPEPGATQPPPQPDG